MSGDPSEKLRNLSILCLDNEDEEYMPADNIYEEADEEDDEDEECNPVALGFVESPKHSWSLHRQLFPSIAGGTPGWLDPINLPNGRSCVCDFCGEPLQFLLQIYAPLSAKESTFHRTIFIFMCTSMSCLLKDQHEQWKRNLESSSRSVKVFRCQLPRFNPFYSCEPPKGDGNDQPLKTGAALCGWCGTWKGDKVCSNCRRVHYCSEKHQAAHWGSGHKTDCQRSTLATVTSASSSNGIAVETQKAASNHLWPQFEIINEDECDYQPSMDSEFDKSLVSRSQVDDDSISSMLAAFEGDSDKKTWVSFQERISRAPEQVLRYYSSGKAKPLWPTSSGQPSKSDIPACCHCGGPRTCELQVLPQLLYYFGVRNDVDSLDWATIVVYTCESSCENGNLSYKEEFVWVQLASQSTTTTTTTTL